MWPIIFTWLLKCHLHTLLFVCLLLPIKSRRPLFQTIFTVMGDLCKFRSSLVSNTLTKEHAEELKKQVVTRIDWGNGWVQFLADNVVMFSKPRPIVISVLIYQHCGDINCGSDSVPCCRILSQPVLRLGWPSLSKWPLDNFQNFLEISETGSIVNSLYAMV